jgi:hypothetical protein
VPQGSILCPLLFLIYVNDIQFASEGTVLSFADDTTVVYSDSNIDGLYDRANYDIQKLHQWFCANKFKLNADKTKYMVFRPKKCKIQLNDRVINVNNIPVERIGNDQPSQSFKFLGVHIDEHLQWDHHVNYICRKIAHTLFGMKQLKYSIPTDCLITLYHSLISPHLSNGILVWGNALQKYIRRLEILQKKAIRIIYKAKYRSHTDPLFKSSKILKLADLYEYQVCLFMYDYEHKNLPLSFMNIFKHNADVHPSRVTRQSHHFYIKKSKSQFSMKLPLFNFPRIWNALCDNIPQTQYKSSVKKFLKRSYILQYSSEIHCQYEKCPDCVQ